MKKRIFALLMTLALLITCAVVTVNASNEQTATESGAFDRTTDKCPCCGKVVENWTELADVTATSAPNLDAGHYVVTKPMTFTGSYYNITGSKNVVIVLENVLTAKANTNILRVGMGSSTFANCKVWLLGGAIANAADDAQYKYGAMIGSGASSTNSTKNGSLMRFGYGADVTIGGALTIALTGEVTSGGKGGVFDIYGGKVTMTGGTIVGMNSSSTVETYGAAILRSGGTFEMSGGTINGVNSTLGTAVYIHGSAESGRTAGTFTMTGGTINGGTATSGGAIYQGGGSVAITGGTINGGTATSGGAIYVAGGSLTMNSDTSNPNGGAVNGGIAGSGGAIYLAADASFTLTKGTINGCNITNDTTTVVNGGAIYSVATGETAVQLNGGTINGGTIARAANSSKNITALKGRGGALYINAGVVNLGGVNIVGGKAHEGGCVYVNSGTLNMTAGTMSLGDGLSNGGTIFLKGTMNMSGGTITANPNNTYAYSKGIRVANGKLNLSGTAHVISAGGSEGNAIYAVTTSATGLAKVSLAGQAKVTNPNGSQTNNIFLSNWGPDGSTDRYASQIEVAAGWSGMASVKFGYIYGNTYALPDAEYTIGMNFPAAYASATGDFTGTLYMEEAPLTPTIWWDGATGLKASSVQLHTDGDMIWMKNNAAAVNESAKGYIKLYNAEPVKLNGKSVYVDFNGYSPEVTLEGGKLYGFDSTATIQQAGVSRVRVTDGAAEFCATNPVNGKTSFARVDNGETVFHMVDISINSVTLRPGTAGVYYGAKFQCDDTLKAYIDTFGVAVSLTGVPGADFATDGTVLYTVNGKGDFGSGSYQSVLVDRIMENQLSADENKSRGETVIYANAYMVMDFDGQKVTIMADKAAQLSLKDVLKLVDKNWYTLSEASKTNVIENIYNPYVAEFADDSWNLTNLEAATADKDRELKVLTIGNSLAVDAGRMLAYVAQQEGSVSFKVGTLYKANCSVQEHADFLTNDKPNYWYYESGFDAENPAALTTGSLVPSETKQYVGYNAIVAEDWDIIIMQHSVFGSAKANTYDESIDTIIEYVNTHKTNPNAIFVWNMTWMGPVDDELLATAETSSPGFDKSYMSYTKSPLDREAQTMMYEQISGAVKEKIFTDDRFAYILPSATMMQNALTATSDKVMYRDYIHGSDYGRLMNAYLWYSMLTGKTITEPAVDAIPGALRFASANRANDLTLSQRMKDVLVESVNNAIKNPFEETVSQYQQEKSLKVLAIGNSFSVDAMWHLEEVARSEGYTDVKIATLFIGGCTLKTHWAKAEGDLAAYTYYYNYDGNWKETANYKISQALSEQDWDVITLQQASGGSGQASTYEPYLENMINYLQTNAPEAKILWHMTWAYSQDSTHQEFPKYESDQTTMYNAIIGAVETAVVPYMTAGDISGLIPSGTAIQNVRTSYLGDELDRDGYHMNLTGRVVTACTWYSVLTGNQLDELSAFYFADNYIGGKILTLTDADRAMIVEAVNNAVENPYQVTAFAN